MKESFQFEFVPESYEIRVTTRGGNSYDNFVVEMKAIIETNNVPGMQLEAVSMTVCHDDDPNNIVSFKADIDGSSEREMWTTMSLILHKVLAAVAEDEIHKHVSNL